jgi:hypothetical protein
MAPQGEQYHPKDAVGAGINGTLITGAAGLAVSSIQNTLTKRNVGALGVLTRTGSTVAIMGTKSQVSRKDWTDGMHSCYGWYIRVHAIRICQLEREG